MAIRANEETSREAKRIAGAITLTSEEVSDAVQAVLTAVFEDPEIAEVFQTGAIQLVTLRGIIAQQVLETLGFNKDAIGVMVIGDIELPEFMHSVMDEILAAQLANNRALFAKRGSGYDIPGQGLPEARRSMINYFDRFFGFSDSTVSGLKEKLAQNAAIVGGGMQAIEMIIGAINFGVVEERRKKGGTRKTRMNHADNTFAMTIEITDRMLVDEPSERNVCPTQQKNLLHLTPTDIDVFYAEKGTENAQDIWYFIPVGNPSGTADSSENLYATCQKILEHNPDAVIVLDCAYVRTMGPKRAKKQFAQMLNDERILQRVVFVESFSKSHGFCGFRAGTYFSYNDALFQQILGYDRIISQGHGLDKSAFIQAVCDTNDAREARIQQLRQFWGRERLGLYHYLMDHRFRDLFDEDQCHLTNEQLNDPENTTSIYLTLKLKPGVTIPQVGSATGCLGFPCNTMKSGPYIRFSVGVLTEPTYAKYIPEAVAG